MHRVTCYLTSRCRAYRRYDISPFGSTAGTSTKCTSAPTATRSVLVGSILPRVHRRCPCESIRYLPPQPQRQEYLPYRVFRIVSCGGVLVGYLEVVLTMWAACLRTPGVVAASLHTSVLRILELMVLTYGTMCSS